MRRFVIPIAIALAIGAWLLWPVRSRCDVNHGLLFIKYIQQKASNWCWVATVEEILGWYRLPAVEQCHLYDLVRGTHTCDAIATDPSWDASDGNNDTGNPVRAATAYKTWSNAGFTIRERDKTQASPNNNPMEFGDIIEQICPADQSLGTPFIWRYIKGHDENGNPLGHDVVIVGYRFYQLSLTPISGPLGGYQVKRQILYMDDPAGNLGGYAFNYILYANYDIWKGDLTVLSKMGSLFIPEGFSWNKE